MKLNYETDWELEKDLTKIKSDINDSNDVIDYKKYLQKELAAQVNSQEGDLLHQNQLADSLFEKLVGITFSKYLLNANSISRYDLLKITYALNTILKELSENDVFMYNHSLLYTMKLLGDGYLNRSNIHSNVQNQLNGKIEKFKQRDFISMFKIEFSHHIKDASNNFQIPFYMSDILREAIKFGLESIPYLSKSNELNSTERSDIHLHLIEELSKAISEMQQGFNYAYQQDLKSALRARLV